MATRTDTGLRVGEADPCHRALTAAAGVVPARVGSLPEARAVFDRDGAVILRGGGVEPDDAVVAAATLLGTRLREVYPPRPTRGTEAGPLALHPDGAHVVVDVAGRTERRRALAEDLLLQLCAQPAPAGGDSVVVDGYRLVDDLRQTLPDLHAFLSAVDVDHFGGWVSPPRGVGPTPALVRMHEHTRGGRRIVRASGYAVPGPREPDTEHHERMLAVWADVLASAFETAPRFRLDRGDLLALDNYRFLHGRDAYSGGDRLMHILTARSADA